MDFNSSTSTSTREAKDVKRDPESSCYSYKKGWSWMLIMLRAGTAAGTLGATWLMLTSHQYTIVFGLHIGARWSYSPAFKFFAIVNAVVGGSTAVSSLLQVAIISNRLRRLSCQSQPANFLFLFFIHDLVMMSVEVAGCAAATAIGYVGKHGNVHSGWMPICEHFGKFCNRVTASLVLGYLSVLSFLLLTITAASKLRQYAQPQPLPCLR